MHARSHLKADGRRLILYGRERHALPLLSEAEPVTAPHPHLRWHPLRGEWVIYAAHRQERTFLPPPEFCPLCPTRPDGPPTEIPFAGFEIAVFENRFPALVRHPLDPPGIPVRTAPAGGACEVVVYTAAHHGSLGTLSQERRELLLRVWADRYRELYARDDVRFVMPFENRGEVIGVTLHHPHGQIYAYPFIPPVIEAEVAAFKDRGTLQALLGERHAACIVEQDHATAVIASPFARFPYEVWVIPRQIHPGLWTFDDGEVSSFARALGRVVRRYDALFGRPFPYVMALHAAPKGAEHAFHFHVEFYPLQRSADRLKYLAGTELGAGAFTVDVLPEDAARALRQIEP